MIFHMYVCTCRPNSTLFQLQQAPVLRGQRKRIIDPAGQTTRSRWAKARVTYPDVQMLLTDSWMFGAGYADMPCRFTVAAYVGSDRVNLYKQGHPPLVTCFAWAPSAWRFEFVHRMAIVSWYVGKYVSLCGSCYSPSGCIGHLA